MVAMLFSSRVNWSLPLIELRYNSPAPGVLDIDLPQAAPIAAGIDPQALLVSKGDIDRPEQKGELVGQKGTVMTINGWIAFAGNERPEELIAYLDDAEAARNNIFTARREPNLRFNRPDVALAGWELRLRANVPAGVHRLELRALLDGKQIAVAAREILVVN